jgi:hypothetical protein
MALTLMTETMRSYLLALLSPSWWNISGLAVSLVGLLLLFYFGMPFRTRRDGAGYIKLMKTDENALRIEKRYSILGRLGLFIVIVGTLCQMIGAWLSN